MNAFKYGVAAPLLAGLAAVFLSAGQATAQPVTCDNGTGYLTPTGHCRAKASGPTNGCNPYSGELNSCLGGGPWQNQDGSSPDTYGPTGERAFLKDALLVFPNTPPQVLLDSGRELCGFFAQGYSNNTIEAALVKVGIHEGDAGYLVTISDMYLC